MAAMVRGRAVDQAFECALDQVQKAGFMLGEINRRQLTASGSHGWVTVDQALPQAGMDVDFLSVTVLPGPGGGAAVEVSASTVRVTAGHRAQTVSARLVRPGAAPPGSAAGRSLQPARRLRRGPPRPT